MIENLMKPRFKVVADWPMNNYYDVGEIIEMKLRSNGTYWNGEDSYYLTEEEMKLYPHLFKPLPWYVERSAESMPEYVRLNPINTPPYDSALLSKVYSWCNGNAILELTMGGKCTLHGGYLLPATLEEFTNYQNKQNERI